MWYKGIVMEVKDKYLIVMREDSTLVKIDIKDKPKVGERLIFTDEDIYEVREAKSLKKKNMTLFIALAAVLVLCILPIINNGNLKAYALVSLDINPSIEFELDENKNIINIYTINTDAKSIDLEDIKGLNIEEGVIKLKGMLESEKYNLKNDNMIVGFTFLRGIEDLNYEEDIKGIMGKNFNESKVLYLKGTKDDCEKAKERGISLGRYEAELDIDDDIEDIIEDMSVEEIMKLLNNNSGVYLNEEVKDEIEDELEDKLEEGQNDDREEDDINND